MRTWLLLSRFECGGLERVQVNLAPALREAGLDVRIVTGKIHDDAKRMFPTGVPVMQISPDGRAAFARRLISELRRQRPDTVLTTSNDVGCLVLVLRALLFPRMKVIWTQHSSVSAPWRGAKGALRIKHGLLILLMRLLLPLADAVIAVSAALADDMRRTLRVRGRIHTIHNPILLPNFPAAMQEAIDWPWRDRTLPTIVFVGRLVPVKRLDVLLAAFCIVCQQNPVRMLIVGDGEERQFVKNVIVRHDIGSLCHMVGHQDNPLPWIKASSVLVLSSDYEGFGNVLVEAMACGTQVISTDCPDGPAEILGNGRYGQLVPSGDVAAMAAAMRSALSGQFHVSAADLKTRAEEFDLERASLAYLHVIESAARESN